VSAARLFGARAGLIAGLTLALYAPAIFLDSLLQKSVLDAFFVSGIVTALAFVLTGDDRRRWWAVAGLAAGALALTANARARGRHRRVDRARGAGRTCRPRRRLPSSSLGVAALAPVAAQLRRERRGVLTTSQFGPNFYIGNNAGADGSYQSLRFGRGSPSSNASTRPSWRNAASRTLTPAEVSSYWTGRATAFITGQPGAWLALMARKAALLVNAREAIDTESQESYAEWSWPLRLLGPVMHFGVLVPLAAFGLWATWADRRRLAVFLAMAFAFAVSTIAFYVFARYRYPLVPLLVLFAAAGVAALPRLVASTPRPRLIMTGLATLAVAAVCHVPLLSATRSVAITDTNLGTALYEAGRLDEAIARYRRASTRSPTTCGVQQPRGDAARRGPHRRGHSCVSRRSRAARRLSRPAHNPRECAARGGPAGRSGGAPAQGGRRHAGLGGRADQPRPRARGQGSVRRSGHGVRTRRAARSGLAKGLAQPRQRARRARR
jgi:hypothetical protein